MMIDLSGFDLLVPLVVSVLIILLRQFTEKLDGPWAYAWSVALNILVQVFTALQGGDPGAAAAVTGLGTGAILGPGMVTTTKRLGLGKMVKPRQ